IQGRHRKETGKKGCYLIQLSKQECQTTFIPLHHIQFKELTIQIPKNSEIEEIETKLNKKLVSSEEEDVPLLLHLTWELNSEDALGSHTSHKLSDLLEIVNERLLQQTPWMYIYRSYEQHN